MQNKFLLNQARNVESEKSSTTFPIEIPNDKDIIVNDHFNEVVNQYNVYLDEREECNKIRLTAKINLLASNIAFNSISEIVKNEGGDNCVCLNYEPKNIPSSSKGSGYYWGTNMSYAVENTEISWNGETDKCYTYLCGFDIFDNSVLKSATNNINVEYTFLQSIDRNFTTQGGWLGFVNKSSMLIYNEGGKNPGNNRVLNNVSPNKFVDLFPGKDRYAFTPHYNQYRDRYEKNWECCLTYPYSSTSENISFINSELNTLKIAFIDENESNEEYVCKIYSICKHGLNEGDLINLYRSTENNDKHELVEENLEVDSVDDDYTFTVTTSDWVCKKWLSVIDQSMGGNYETERLSKNLYKVRVYVNSIYDPCIYDPEEQPSLSSNQYFDRPTSNYSIREELSFSDYLNVDYDEYEVTGEKYFPYKRFAPWTKHISSNLKEDAMERYFVAQREKFKINAIRDVNKWIPDESCLTESIGCIKEMENSASTYCHIDLDVNNTSDYWTVVSYYFKYSGGTSGSGVTGWGAVDYENQYNQKKDSNSALTEWLKSSGCSSYYYNKYRNLTQSGKDDFVIERGSILAANEYISYVKTAQDNWADVVFEESVASEFKNIPFLERRDWSGLTGYKEGFSDVTYSAQTEWVSEQSANYRTMQTWSGDSFDKAEAWINVHGETMDRWVASSADTTERKYNSLWSSGDDNPMFPHKTFYAWIDIKRKEWPFDDFNEISAENDSGRLNWVYNKGGNSTFACYSNYGSGGPNSLGFDSWISDYMCGVWVYRDFMLAQTENDRLDMIHQIGAENTWDEWCYMDPYQQSEWLVNNLYTGDTYEEKRNAFEAELENILSESGATIEKIQLEILTDALDKLIVRITEYFYDKEPSYENFYYKLPPTGSCDGGHSYVVDSIQNGYKAVRGNELVSIGSKNLSFTKVVDGDECNYYVKLLRRFPNFDFYDKEITEDNIYGYDEDLGGRPIDVFSQIEYEKQSTISKLGFAKNVYGDNMYQIVFNDDINIDVIKDNLGRPLTSLYLSFFKTNYGYRYWYQKRLYVNGTTDKSDNNYSPETDPSIPDYKNKNVEWSRCFGKLNAGFELSPWLGTWEPTYDPQRELLELHNGDWFYYVSLGGGSKNEYLYEHGIQNFVAFERLSDKIKQEMLERHGGTLSEYTASPNKKEYLTSLGINSLEAFNGLAEEKTNTFPNIHTMNNVYKQNCGLNQTQLHGGKYGLPTEIGENPESTVTVDDDEIFYRRQELFYGDLCEYSKKSCTETVIQECFHRFNTMQRELDQPTGYFTQKGFGDVQYRTGEYSYRSYDTRTRRHPNGYYYKTNYEIPIRSFSQKITEFVPKFIPIIGMGRMDRIDDDVLEYDTLLVSASTDTYFTMKSNPYIYDTESGTSYQFKIVNILDLNVLALKFIDDELNTAVINNLVQRFEENRYRFKLYDRYMVIPDYAEMEPKYGIYRWRDVIQNGFEDFEDIVPDYPFTNGCLYVNRDINIFLRRQDPFGYYGLMTSDVYYSLPPVVGEVNPVENDTADNADDAFKESYIKC